MRGKVIRIRLSASSKRTLDRVTVATGLSPDDAVATALDSYSRKVFLEAVNESFARMSDDELADYKREFDEWDAITDGLSENEWVD
jgi:hypothetical protein